MPSKRTNDSVERILEELSHQQARDGVRDSVNERKVDEILKSVGIDTAAPGTSQDSLGPIGKEDLPRVEVSGGMAEDRFSTAVLDDLLSDLPSMKFLKKKTSSRTQPQPAPQAKPVQQRQAPQEQPARRTAPVQPARPARQEQPVPSAQPVRQQPQVQQRPVQQPVQRPAQREEPARSAVQEQPVSRPVRQEPPARQTPESPRRKDDTLSDTTRTSIIKNFLLKMAPGGDHADTNALNEGKEQFQQFFGKTAAVLPDEDGKLRDPSRRKRGLFGLGKAEDTGEFVPINVSLGGRREEPAPQPEPAEEVYAAPEPEETEFYDEVYDADTADDGEAADPAYEQEPAPRTAPSYREETFSEPEVTVAEPEEPTVQKTVYHSNRGGAAASLPNRTGNTGGITLTGIRAALRGSSSGATGTVYRKKRNTIEFTPGQKLARTPDVPPAAAETRGEPVGEPVMTSTAAVESPSTTAFNIPLQKEEAAEDTKDFLKDLGMASAVKTAAHAARAVSAPAAVERQTPAEPAAPVRDEPVEEAPAPRQEPVRTAREDTFEEISRDEAVTLTGEVRLADIAAGRTQEDTSAFASDLEHAGTHEVSPDTADFMAQLESQPRPRPDTGAFVREIEQSINEEEGSAQVEDRFAQAANILTDTSEVEDLPKTSKPARTAKGKGGIRLTGTPDDEQEGENAEPPFEEEDAAPASRHREYERLDDAPAVRRELNNRILLLTTAAIVSGVAAVVMLYLGIAAGGTLPLPGPLDTLAGTTPLLATMLVLLVVCCALNWRTMLDGLLGVVKSPTADTLPALAALGAVVQLAAFLIQPEWYDPEKLCLLAGPAALVLCFNALGKRLDAITTRENFQLVSAKVDHAVAYRLKDAGILRAVTRGLDQPRPNVLVSRPTQLMKDFLSASSAHRTSDKNQQQLGRLVGGVALAALVFTLLYRKDAGLAFTAMAAVLCLGAPLAGTLLSALPARLMQRSAAQVGAVIPGWRDIRQLGRVNVIQVTTQDLFPKGCVKLCGIKPVNKERIDLAITYAASMMADGAPTLREVFMGMIGDNRKLLSKVDDFETVYGMGYVGWIDGERVLAGNRRLMEKFDIQLPSLEYEQRHTVNQRRVIYLAVSGKLFSMFQVAYQADPDTAAVLDGLRRTGMSLIVDCDDFNCDESLLEAAYTLPTGTVRVLDAAARKALEPATAWLPESEGNMLHLGSFVSYVGGLEAAAGAAEGERKAAMILSVSVLLSCVLAIVMVLAGGIAALPLPALVLYQAAWAVLALIFPMLQRY